MNPGAGDGRQGRGFHGRDEENETDHLGCMLNVGKGEQYVYGTRKMRDARKSRKRTVEGCNMYIVRLKKDGNGWAMSRPCRECWEVIHSLGIRKVYYSTGEETWMCEKVASMEITHQSSGALALQTYREKDRMEKKGRS
jgi:hypothetical protein